MMSRIIRRFRQINAWIGPVLWCSGCTRTRNPNTEFTVTAPASTKQILLDPEETLLEGERATNSQGPFA